MEVHFSRISGGFTYLTRVMKLRQCAKSSARHFRKLLSVAVLLVSDPCAGTSLEKQGLQALKDRIPEVAVARFSEALLQIDISDDTRKRVTRQLVEARLRAGQHEEVLAMFAKAKPGELDESRFWKGLALAALGSLSEAENELTAHAAANKADYLDECLISLARVQANRGDARNAIATLQRVPKSSLSLLRARIDQCHLYLLMDKPTEARKILPEQSALSKSASFEIRMLNARILLAETKAEAALSAFSTLRKEFSPPQANTGLHSRALADDLHLCAIGEARARHALGKVTEATDNLLAFIQNNPQSPVLADAFSYLLEWLPAYSADAEVPIRARILERFEEWSPLHRDRSYSLISTDEDSVVGLNTHKNANLPQQNLHAHALHARIFVLHHNGNSAAVGEMRRLVFAMQAIHPDKPLTYESWLLWAQNALARADRSEAQRVLQFLAVSASGVPQVDAAVLLAQDSFLAADFNTATEWFADAARKLRAEPRRSALFNSALAALKHHNQVSFEKIYTDAEPKLQVNLTLEKALATARTDTVAALPLLEKFLASHPSHKRANEARLALAHYAMQGLSHNLAFAKTQLDNIDSKQIDAELLAHAWMQLAHAEMNHSELAVLCRKFLTDFPNSPGAEKARFQLGVSLYQTGDYSESRMILEKLAADSPALAGPATMFAARAAARSGTPQSITEAGALYDAIAAMNSPLSISAVLEKARVFMDSKDPEKLASASASLSKLIGSDEKITPQHVPAYLMLIECQFALGSSDSQNYANALSIQRKLLDLPDLTSSDRYRVFYYRGLCLEKLGKESDAIDFYYQVIESASNSKPISWEYVDRCNFNALAILEKNKRWESAIALARKISALQGPRAKEAEERARRFTLENFIFDQ